MSDEAEVVSDHPLDDHLDINPPDPTEDEDGAMVFTNDPNFTPVEDDKNLDPDPYDDPDEDDDYAEPDEGTSEDDEEAAPEDDDLGDPEEVAE